MMIYIDLIFIFDDTKHQNAMKKMSTIAELDAKMLLIASFAGMSLDKFRKLSPKKFIAICNDYHAKNK